MAIAINYVPIRAEQYAAAQHIARTMSLVIYRVAHYEPGRAGVACAQLNASTGYRVEWTAEQRQQFADAMNYYDGREW